MDDPTFGELLETARAWNHLARGRWQHHLLKTRCRVSVGRNMRLMVGERPMAGWTGRDVPAALPTSAEFYAITRLARVLIGAGHAAVNLFDEVHQFQLSGAGDGWSVSPRQESICSAAVVSDQVVHVTDAAADPALSVSSWVDGRRGRVRMYAGAPLLRGGHIVGTLCVWDDEPGQLHPEQLQNLQDLAGLVVAVLERQQATAEARTAHHELLDAHRQVLRGRAFTEALLEALPVGVVAADADGRVTLFNQVSRRWHGQDTDERVSPDSLAATYDLFDADGTTPLTADRVPLLRAFEEGRVDGAEVVIHPHGAAPRVVTCSATEIRDDQGELLGAVVAMADITEQRRLEQQLRAAALHDALTGLPNRSLLTDRLTHALSTAERTGAQVAVLYGDLDGFKAVNDRHGHGVGDEVLVQAAGRLVGVVRPGDTVARMGGDEFVVLCPDITGTGAEHDLARRVTDAFAEPFRTSAGEHRVGISIGSAVSGADSRAASLLASADRAMYRVKNDRFRPSPRPHSPRADHPAGDGRR